MTFDMALLTRPRRRLRSSCRLRSHAAVRIILYCVTSVVTLIVIGLTFVAPAKAMTVRDEWRQQGFLVLHLEGQIDNGDYQKMMNFLARVLPQSGRAKVKGIISLNSPGGAVLEAMKIAARIHDTRQAVTIEGKHQCASACFMLFAAGQPRFASPEALVGVHRARRDPDGGESSASTLMDIEMARQLKEYGVPPGIIGRLVTTSPHQIYWLTQSDLLSMEVAVIPNSAQLTEDWRVAMPADTIRR